MGLRSRQDNRCGRYVVLVIARGQDSRDHNHRGVFSLRGLLRGHSHPVQLT